MTFTRWKKEQAFTIVELLVVIVVIGILAAISFVSYSGIQSKAITAGLKSQLSSDFRVLKLYYVDYGGYPTALDANYCPTLPTADSKYCIKNMNGSSMSYTGSVSAFSLTMKNIATGIAYKINDGGDIAEVLPYSFATSWGGSGADYATSIVQADDGGYVTTGETSSFGSGNYDVFIAKYSESGVLQWSRIWGGTDSETPNSITKTTDGGFVVTGYTASFGTAVDAFIVKYSSDGTYQWNKTWGGSSSDYGVSVTSTRDGGVAVTGYTSSFGFGGSVDAFLVKFDSAGNFSWNKTWGSITTESNYSVIQTLDDGYLVSGTTFGFNPGGNYDACIAKFDSSGNLSWSKTLGFGGYDFISAAVQNSDGTYMVSGSIYYGTASGDAFIAKYASDGTLSWIKTWGGSADDRAHSIAQLADGDYIIVGYTESFGAGGSDAFAAKFKSDGTYVWSKTWGGTGTDLAQSVVKASDGGFALVGPYAAANRDAVIVKYLSSGVIANCSASMCKNITTATIASPTPTVSGPTATVTTPAATVGSPASIRSTPNPTSTILVAP